MRHKWDNRWHKVVTESINTLRIRRMNPRDPLGWKSSFLADCIKWDSQQRNRSCKERNWLEGYSLGHTIAKKVGKLGFENRQDQKTKQYLFDHSQNQAKNHSSEISSAAGHTDHALQSTAWHWIQTPSLKKQLVVAAVPSIYQNGLPHCPRFFASVPSAWRQVWGRLAKPRWVPRTFDKQVSSVFHFYKERMAETPHQTS